MFCTDILASLNLPDRHYLGHTADLRARLAEQKSGKSPHTAKDEHQVWLTENFATPLKSNWPSLFTLPQPDCIIDYTAILA